MVNSRSGYYACASWIWKSCNFVAKWWVCAFGSWTMICLTWDTILTSLIFTSITSNENRRKITVIFAVALDSVAEECNLSYAIALIPGNSTAKQIISYSGMYLVDFCGILQGWNSLLWTSVVISKPPKAWKKLPWHKGCGGNTFQHLSRVCHGICSSLALESLALHLARLLITAYKILSTWCHAKTSPRRKLSLSCLAKKDVWTCFSFLRKGEVSLNMFCLFFSPA